jgi:glycosyltransferase involved in cell wall biosynthesis
MSQIYLIINQDSNHSTILNKGGGASELLFYSMSNELSKRANVTVFNRDTPQIIDKIQYKFFPNDLIIENTQNILVIVQRNFDVLIDLHKKNPSNKYVLWLHDYLEGNFENLTGKYKKYEIHEYFSKYKSSITIVSVSHFHKRNVLYKLPNVNVKVIHNALFPDNYKVNKEIQYDKNKMIFASNWAKGLDNVLRIGREYYNKNNQFKLLLIKPNYCEWDPDLHEHPFVQKIGCITDKNQYCELLQSCLAVFTTSYPETFGCVFAEALHLGVPVIGDISRSAGFHDFIPREHMCNFNNPQEVIQKIEEFRENRPIVKLGDKFYSDSIVNEWLKLC